MRYATKEQAMNAGREAYGGAGINQFVVYQVRGEPDYRVGLLTDSEVEANYSGRSQAFSELTVVPLEPVGRKVQL